MPYSFDQSAKLFERATKHITGGINSSIRILEKPVPLYYTHGKGSRLWDVDGNEYIDYQIGQGACLYGHAPDGLVKALSDQAAKGTHWAAQSELEIEVAEKLCAFFPSSDQVRFNNAATDVVQVAFRVARALTGKKHIIRFEGHYHGWLDEGLIGFVNPPGEWGPKSNPAKTHPSAGIIEEVKNYHVLSRWNDIELLKQRVAAYSGDIAAIIFEPINCNTSCIEPVPGMIETIRELCDQENALMISDECITGFRFGRGGAQELFNFEADLTVLGKAIGGGTPFAALVGKSEPMGAIINNGAIHAGTLNANPLMLSASKWCLEQLEELGDEHPKALKALGVKLRDGIQKIADDYGVPIMTQGPGIAFHTTMLTDPDDRQPVREYRDYVQKHDGPRFAHLRQCLLEEGVRAIERGLWFISLAHTEMDIEETLERSKAGFQRHAETWKPGS